MDVRAGTHIKLERIDETASTDLDVAATARPFGMFMHDDAANGHWVEGWRRNRSRFWTWTKFWSGPSQLSL